MNPGNMNLLFESLTRKETSETGMSMELLSVKSTMKVGCLHRTFRNHQHLLFQHTDYRLSTLTHKIVEILQLRFDARRFAIRALNRTRHGLRLLVGKEYSWNIGTRNRL